MHSAINWMQYLRRMALAVYASYSLSFGGGFLFSITRSWDSKLMWATASWTWALVTCSLRQAMAANCFYLKK
ncbi:hypothetical protein BD310DRAFT_926913 [Dichomitus squalens]|uniref:Uncharacterized protein n=1 Tax=Dichomitus squalens TaxID=114155 RepID=A0A4Q9PVI1_9APHY|nr:hypothetical protein BD310DRAFT_926913 [Dichomitus squalens]